ncbi:MAG: hypothetical protein ACJAUE_003366 [Alcanivorax sp.]|jgi:hypothetical protein
MVETENNSDARIELPVAVGLSGDLKVHTEACWANPLQRSNNRRNREARGQASFQPFSARGSSHWLIASSTWSPQ